MFTISKKIYIDLIEKLESAGARAIGFDIVFQNKDPDEGAFRDTLEKYKNIVIATTAVNTCSELERDTLPPAIEIVAS
jgi:CHASE2 domain-containing sensor protein